MSSRLDYQSPAFQHAAADAQALQQWEEQQFADFRNRCGSAQASVDDLLSCAELAMRLQFAATARDCLERVLKLRPLSAEALYLKYRLTLAQEQPAEALAQLEAAARKLVAKNPDNARIWRLLAEQRQPSDLSAAAQAMVKACELAGAPAFLHSAVFPAADLRAEQLAFDYALFDRLYPWEGGKAGVRLTAVATGPENQLYVLDSYNRWIFEFEAQGAFRRGLGEHQLSGKNFLNPEDRWQLSDLCVTPQGLIAVAGQQDRVALFNPDWTLRQWLEPPAAGRRLHPLSLCADSRGYVYVLYLHLGGIHVFNPEGFHEGFFGDNTTMTGTGKNYYCGLTCNEQDQVCLYDREKVQIFQPFNPQPLEVIAPLLQARPHLGDENYPLCWNGICAGPNRQFWLADTARNRMLHLQQGQLADQTAELNPQLKHLSGPFDIACDHQGHLYLADSRNARVLKYQHPQWKSVFAHPQFESV
jgi:sugar lactone lactonase YvrE